MAVATMLKAGGFKQVLTNEASWWQLPSFVYSLWCALTADVRRREDVPSDSAWLGQQALGVER